MRYFTLPFFILSLPNQVCTLCFKHLSLDHSTYTHSLATGDYWLPYWIAHFQMIDVVGCIHKTQKTSSHPWYKLKFY